MKRRRPWMALRASRPDGIELLTQLRRESDVYVITLTAKSEETDEIMSLSVGALFPCNGRRSTSASHEPGTREILDERYA